MVYLQPMPEAAYQAHMGSLSTVMDGEIKTQLSLNKEVILALFPTAVRWGLRLAWPAMLRIGAIIAMALVKIILVYLAAKTINEVAGLILAASQKQTAVSIESTL